MSKRVERRLIKSNRTRRVETRKIRKTVVVFCEGAKTEPQYLEALRRLPEICDIAAVDLRLEAPKEGEVPLTLVRRAVEFKERAAGESAEIDEFWCLFDVEWPEHHPHLRETRNLAVKHGVKLAISNPCFEPWLALPFKPVTAFLNTHEAVRERAACDGRRNKSLHTAVYMDRRAEAVARAAQLEARHTANGTQFPHDNPSSGMHHLLHSIAPG